MVTEYGVLVLLNHSVGLFGALLKLTPEAQTPLAPPSGRLPARHGSNYNNYYDNRKITVIEL